MKFKLIKLVKLLFLNEEEYARRIGVSIGNECKIKTRNFGSEPYLITIGNNVQITSGVKFFTHGGNWIFRKEYPKFDTFGKILIGNNVYIGNNVLLMPGISIPNNTIVGAGSVVTKSFFKEGLIIAGNPAKVIGDVETLKNKLLPYNLNIKGMSYEEKKSFLLNQPDSCFIKK